MFEKKKILILIVIIALILIAISIVLIILKNKNKNKDLDIEQQAYIEYLNNPGKIIDGKKPEMLKIDNLFFTVEKCIKIYYEYINTEKSEAVYALLDGKYIESNKISVDNVLNKISKYENANSQEIKEVYVITGNKYSTFYVKTLLGKESIYYIVNLDSASNAFSIIPINEESYTKKIDEIIETNQQYEDTIDLNDYNAVPYIYLEEVDLVEKYFQNYLYNALFNPERAYNLLDEEYKVKKFGNIDEYKKYIESNRELLTSMCEEVRYSYEDFEDYTEYEEYYAQISSNGIEQYKIEQTGENKRIICIDTYGKYYIFNINSIMNYSLILDTYTIDLPEFTEKYYDATEQQKVALNIDRFIKAINDSDYKYAYSCLADSFKNNYFKTQADFETYARENFFARSSVKYNKFDIQGEYYTYSVIFTDEETGAQKNKTFIMQLGEGTEFKLSFDR